MKETANVVFEKFRTMFNRDVQFTGDLHSGEDVLIAGEIMGKVTCVRALHLLDGAMIGNHTSAQDCTLYGATVSGQLRIGDRLKVYNGSTINGKIHTKVLDIEGGALINATVEMPVISGSENANFKQRAKKG